MMSLKTRKFRSKGYTLIEVLVGIVIFALGMMALASLQGNLAKNSGESNARTVAINIGEEMIEDVRSFTQVTASTDVHAFNNIVSEPFDPISRGGINYAASAVVTNYYYNAATGLFQDSKPNADIINADMKLLQLTVSWGAGQSFQIDESNATTNLSSGSITLTDVISSIPSVAGGKVVLNSTGSELYSPPISYNPGANPDIISIQLGENKFKESTTPLPDVVRANELVETRFDVVTYSQDESGATFLRREEFRAVSCECTLRVPSTDAQGGLRPTIWEGYDYTEGEFVSKPYGESANNQQSQYCGLCCRDHHDGGTGTLDDNADPGRSQYNPFRSDDDYHDGGSFDGDHMHYSRNSRTGELTLADGDGDAYAEACRMVRKNGFFRIAQDLRQEGLNAFPADYLDEDGEVDEYSRYVTDAVTAYEVLMGGTNEYETAPPLLATPADRGLEVPASTPDIATEFESGKVTEQQLRSRGIYVDYMSDVLRGRINCLDLGGDPAACDVPNVTTSLEIIPFYDVQLTWLSRWNETPSNNPIDVTNEAIQNGNAHSRGVATLETGFDDVIITSAVHSGNLGLTGTDPIDRRYNEEEEIYSLYAEAVGETPPPPLSGIVIRGEITSAIAGVKAADVEIKAVGAQCDRTNTGYECDIEVGAPNPRIEVYNYFKQTRVLLACSEVLQVHGTEHSSSTSSNAGNWTRYNLPYEYTVGADIIIKQDNC